MMQRSHKTSGRRQVRGHRGARQRETVVVVVIIVVIVVVVVVSDRAGRVGEFDGNRFDRSVRYETVELFD